MVKDNITCTIGNVFKELDVSSVDDTTYKKLENMGYQYEYIDNDLLEQMIEAELIIMLEGNWFTVFNRDELQVYSNLLASELPDLALTYILHDDVP